MMQIRNNEIGARIMALRTDMGLTRERMAEKVGITSKFLYEIGNYDDEMLETMRMFSPQIWKKIKKMLLIINDIAK